MKINWEIFRAPNEKLIQVSLETLEFRSSDSHCEKHRKFPHQAFLIRLKTGNEWSLLFKDASGEL